MNWEAFGAIGEVVGALGVILTLGFLAIQIRQNTREISASRKVELARNFQSRTEQRIRLHELVIGSDDLAEIRATIRAAGWPGSLEIFESLAPSRQEKYFHWVRTQLIHCENIFYQHELGLVDEELYVNTQRLIAREGRTWQGIGALRGVRPSFVQKIEEILGSA